MAEWQPKMLRSCGRGRSHSERLKTTQSLTWSKIYKINLFSRKCVSGVKFRAFGDYKSNFKKIGWTSPEKPKSEKGWFGSKHNNSTLRVVQKEGLAEPFALSFYHVFGLRRLSYLILKRNVWAICWLKNLDYYPTDRYFITIFVSRAGVYKRRSTFWVAKPLFLIADGNAISHFKEEWESFHMHPNA